MNTHDQRADALSQVVVHGPGAGRSISLGDAGVVTLKAERVETGGTLSAYEFVMPPRTAGPPLHLHRGWDELFYVLDGEMTFLIAGTTAVAPAGSSVFIPRGVLHTFWNEGLIPATQLTVFTPGGIEDYFDAVTAIMGAGGEEALGAASRLMEHHDMIVPPDSRPAYGTLTPADPLDD